MKFLIGEVSAKDVEMFGDEGLYEHDGELFYNMVEIGTNPGGIEDFVISDAIGRKVPVSTEHLGALINALTDIQTHLETVNEGKLAESALFEDEVHFPINW
jgi:hypothetical protein